MEYAISLLESLDFATKNLSQKDHLDIIFLDFDKGVVSQNFQKISNKIHKTTFDAIPSFSQSNLPQWVYKHKTVEYEQVYKSKQPKIC